MRALAVVAALVCSGAALAATAPRVTVDSLSPVTVVGTGFGAGSDVRVTLYAGARHLTKTVPATRTGTFRAIWQTSVANDKCPGIAVSAISGPKRAYWKSVVEHSTCGPPVPAP